MAFISDEHKLVFIHLPKNGGTSIADALCQMHDETLLRPTAEYRHAGVGNDIPKRFKPNGIQVHDPWRTILEKYPECRRYRKFWVVRNPWARIFSFYQHKRRRRDKDLPVLGNGRVMPFKGILRVSNVLLLQPQIWWEPTEYRGSNKATCMRFESMDHHWRDLSAFFDLPKIPLNHLNKTAHEADYREAYDDYGRELIGAFYAKEIEKYGYEF